MTLCWAKLVLACFSNPLKTALSSDFGSRYGLVDMVVKGMEIVEQKTAALDLIALDLPAWQ